jgi:hypothetical protein
MKYHYTRAHRGAWRRIGDDLGAVDFSSRRRLHRRIREAIHAYQAACICWPLLARPDRAGLWAVYEAADALDAALAKLTEIDRQLMRGCAGGHHWFHDGSGFREPVIDIRGLAGAAFDRLGDDKGGKVANVPFINLVDRLARLYEGEPPTRTATAGNLLLLVDAVRGLAGEVPSASEAGDQKAIQRALRVIRAHRH